MKQIRFSFLEVAAFLVFTSLGLWIGTNLGSANAAPSNEQQDKSIPTAPPSLPDGERIILLVGADTLDTGHPHLDSLWLTTYYLDDRPIQFLPIYPTGSDTVTKLENDLIISFSIVHGDGRDRLNPLFLDILNDNNYWLSGYVVFDHYATAYMIDLIGGISDDQGIRSGTQILDTAQQSHGLPQDVHFQQAITMGQACQTIARRSTPPDWNNLLELIPEHILTDLHPYGLLNELQIIVDNPSQLRCEFPSLVTMP